jgi:hypothetical protein
MTLQSDRRLRYFISQNLDTVDDFSLWKEESMNSILFTFEETIELCGVTKWEFDCDCDWKASAKKKWLHYIKKWNLKSDLVQADLYSADSTYGYVAITYLYIVIPYNSLVRNGPACEQVSEFLARLINICMMHETNSNLICFKNYGMLTVEDLEDSIDDSLDKQYNIARWFLMFLVYSRLTGIEVGSPMAMWSSS